ncbi:MAG: GEVED domain-containing protein [Bacteroidota bacterium]|nr:GEVED domain-containing protein [Bacteroidota bacterium]
MFNNYIKFCVLFFLFFYPFSKSYSQCSIIVDTANLGHIVCPSGASLGSASILQTGYQNFAWYNISNGQIYGNGPGVASLSNLDAGLYVVTGSSPYSSSCPAINYSDTFEILEPTPNIIFSPTQACPDLCNVVINIELLNAINGINYFVSLDNSSPLPIGTAFLNQCGGSHQYEIFADGLSCGVESFGVSQFAQMNLETTVNNVTCSQTGSATVNITGVGASSLNSYCQSSPQYNNYSTIDKVEIFGDNTFISNNTSGQCDIYQSFITQSADLTPGNQYILNLELGTCNPGFFLIDIANIYIDWNIDGDFDDLNELVGQIPAQQSPSVNSISFVVPIGAIPGQSRMRIVSQNSQYQPNNSSSPCDYQTAWFGSTEDYTIVVNGSVANPINYLWSNGQTSQTASNLTAGTYVVNVTDANGCTASDTTIIISMGPFVADITPVLQTVCRNESSDSLIVTSSGDSGPYQYQWFEYPFGNQANQATIIPNANDSFLIPATSNIGLQFFFCIVTSGTGCIDTTNIISFETVTSPKIIEQPQDTAVCIDANLTITIQDTFFVNVAANTITPIYQWYQNSICDIGSAVPALGAGNNTSIYTPPTSLPGTTYYYCVVNIPQIIGCSSDTSACAEVIVNPTATVTLTTLPSPACEGDNIQLIANTSIPVNQYRFQYNDGSGWQNILTNTTWGWGTSNPVLFSNITTTTQFRVRVREDLGCNSSTWSPIITVPVNNILTPPISHN